MQMTAGSILLLAMSVPPNTTAANVSVYATSTKNPYRFDYTPASSVAEVRGAAMGDRYWLDISTGTLFWRVVKGYVQSDGTFGFMDDQKWAAPFTRAGMTVNVPPGPNTFQIHVEVACATDNDTGAFCATQPIFQVPPMGCAEGEVMLAIDSCGDPCHLDGSCLSPPPFWPPPLTPPTRPPPPPLLPLPPIAPPSPPALPPLPPAPLYITVRNQPDVSSWLAMSEIEVFAAGIVPESDSAISSNRIATLAYSGATGNVKTDFDDPTTLVDGARTVKGFAIANGVGDRERGNACARGGKRDCHRHCSGLAANGVLPRSARQH